MGRDKTTFGFLATWSMAVGGMVGGGIYIALGVVVSVAAQWAWLSFVMAGLVALTTAYSYARLANEFQENGGAFEFLREINHEGLAGSLSWMLIIGYVLTMAVYAFAFGHYLSHAFAGNPWLMRVLAVGVVGALVTLNLAGAGQMKKVELAIVWGNLLALLLLAGWGLAHWDSLQLVSGIEPRSLWAVPLGAAVIFMAFEGFQLLTYEYGQIDNPQRILLPALLSAVAFVIVIYVVVALAATMLAGALTVVDEKQVALSVAAERAMGTPGLVMMTIAATFATAAAINSTLFSTAQLCKRVADDGELPAWFEHRNSAGVPARAVVALGVVAGLLAIIGTLSTLVEAASLAFLFTFGTVNVIAAAREGTRRWVPVTGTVIAAVIAVVLLVRLAVIAPLPLGLLVLLALLATVGRPLLMRTLPTAEKGE